MIYFLGLGSNIGDLEENMCVAIDKISQVHGCKVLQKSNVYMTKAWGFEEQDDFLNMVLEIETDISPQMFIKYLKDIEVQMGRVKTQKWGPRVMDIDILYCDDMVMETDELVIPHPYLHKREFVLKPLVEIAKDFVHPVLHRTNGKLFDLLEGQCQA